MTLYHFCAAHMKNGILREGLREGRFPLLSDGELISGVQWLTTEKDPNKQSWATRNLIPYSRTAYRLTVNIPESRRRKLVPAHEWVKRFSREDQRAVLDWDGSEAWWVFTGNIPAKWVIGCRKMSIEGGEYDQKRNP